ERLGVAGRRREVDRALLVAVGLEAEGEAQPGAGEPPRGEALAEPLEGGAPDEEEGLEGDERPLRSHPLPEGEGGLAADGRAGAGGWGGGGGGGWGAGGVGGRSRPTPPSRLATCDLGRRAKSPTERTPQRSRVMAIPISGARRPSGSGARKAASSPAATTTG